MHIKSLLLLLTVVVVYVDSFRILSIFQHPGSSHFTVFKPLLRRLAEIGHEITVISHFPLEDPPKNYKDISLFGTVPIWKSVFHFENFTYFPPTERFMVHWTTGVILTQMSGLSCEAMLKNTEVQALKPGDFDLVIYEEFNSDCSAGLAYKMKVPFLTLSSHVMMAWTLDNFGLITNPSYIATHHLEHGRKLNAFEAAESFVVAAFYRWYFYLYSQIPERRMIEKYLHVEMPPLESVASSASLILVNTYFPLNGANPVPPNVVEIGGVYHDQVKELPKDIKQFLDNASDGVILFSMGSMLKATTWPKDKLKIFQEVFSELPQKIVWKWENDTMDGCPKNVKLLKWIPQFDILHHKNVRVFITHAGMLGISEAVTSGVPALTIPIYGDQFCNAAALEESGGGVYMNYRNITKESIGWALKTLLDPEMKASAERLSAVWNDRPMSAMDTAVYWIEHVARHGGAHLQPTSKELPLYRYLLLDVFAILIATSAIALYIIYVLLKILLSFLSNMIFRKVNKNKKND